MKNIDNISSDFLLSLVTEKNMSLNTASSYRADLKIFFTFIKDKNLNVETLKKDDINKFFQNQRERNFADNTISRRLSTLKQFFKFLIKEGLLDRNPCEDIKNFKKAKKILENFEDELKNFKQVCPIEMLDKLDNPISLKPHVKKAG